MNESLLSDGHKLDTNWHLPCGDGPAASPKWFAVFTSSHHEKRVSFHFEQRGIEHFLPVYEQDRKWKNGLKVRLALPLFPNYIFARFEWTKRVSVLEVPHLHRIIGSTGGKPMELSNGEIQALRSGLALRRAEPHPFLTVGQRVRIRTGAFTGMEGVVLRNKGSIRVVLTIELMMRSVSIEVDESELEPLREAHRQ